MNNRLLQIIKYKTNGRKQKFGELMGWSSQYLSKLLRGDNFGLQPVLTILKMFPLRNSSFLSFKFWHLKVQTFSGLVSDGRPFFITRYQTH